MSKIQSNLLLVAWWRLVARFVVAGWLVTARNGLLYVHLEKALPPMVLSSQQRMSAALGKNYLGYPLLTLNYMIHFCCSVIKYPMACYLCWWPSRKYLLRDSWSNLRQNCFLMFMGHISCYSPIIADQRLINTFLYCLLICRSQFLFLNLFKVKK